MSYENGKHGSDTMFTFKSQDLAFLVSKNSFELKVNQEFIETMISRELEAELFLLNFYDQYFLPVYTSYHKICTIKEIIKEESELI